MYYGIVSFATVLFSLQFYLNQRYEKENGAGLRAAMVFSLISNLAGSVILLGINRFQLTVTWFTAMMAAVSAGTGVLFQIFSMKAFARINMSVYSIFSMLGGMTLPFVLGICCYGEAFTLGKALCFLLIVAALLLTVEKGGSSSGWPYYIGIFVLNGMAGVLSKIYQEALLPKGSAADYTILSALLSVLLSGVILLLSGGKTKKLSRGAWGAALGYGTLNRFANWLLLIALVHLPASAQYPMITGGVMVCSTVLCCFTPEKPRAKDWISVGLSFAGILLLVLL